MDCQMDTAASLRVKTVLPSNRRDCVFVLGWRCPDTNVLAHSVGSLRSWSSLRRCVEMFTIVKCLTRKKIVCNLEQVSVRFACWPYVCGASLPSDGSSATPRCGSSLEEHHFHTGALWQFHWAAGETTSEHLQVRAHQPPTIYNMNVFPLKIWV